MHNATVHIMTALYALHHAIAITPEEASAIARSGARLSPSTWRQTRGLLREVEAAELGPDLELGFTSLVTRWLGHADEIGFEAAHGVAMCEVLSRDSRQLAPLARGIENLNSPLPERLRGQITIAWCGRAGRLLADLPETGVPALEALRQALAQCPPVNTWRRRICAALADASAAVGDHDGVALARVRLAELRETEVELGVTAHAASARILSILWCVANDCQLLDRERGLDPDFLPWPDLWSAVRSSIGEGRIEDVPVPLATFAAWAGFPKDGRGCGESPSPEPVDAVVPLGAQPMLDAEVLRRCLRETANAGLLAAMARLVDSVWGGGEEALDVPEAVSRCLVETVCARRAALEENWTPLHGQPHNPWLESYQGARRRATVERVAVLEALQPVLLRCAAFDPVCELRVACDRATVFETMGCDEMQREALSIADAISRQLSDGDPWRCHVQRRLAHVAWHTGDVSAATKILQSMADDRADASMRMIEAKAVERAEANRLEAIWQRKRDLNSGCDLAWAHQAAGHTVRARQVAAEVAAAHPQDPVSWAMVAAIMVAQGRYRDAVAPAAEAHELGHQSYCSKQFVLRVPFDFDGWDEL